MPSVVKQYDSRWGSRNYNGSSTIAMAACGPFSVSNTILAPGNKLDPMEVVKFMQQNGYAVRNHGTAWSGIPAALKNFGAEDVKEINVDRTMKNVWAHMEKGYTGVFLFSAGSRGGVCWTTSGHYISVTDYKRKDKKHILYTRDSGGRDHDGWYCYETQMKGLIPKVWVGKVPIIKPKKEKIKKLDKPTSLPKLPQRGWFIKGDEGSEVTKIQNILNYLKFSCGSPDGSYGRLTCDAVVDYQKKYKLGIDGKWGKECNRKAKDILGL